MVISINWSNVRRQQHHGNLIGFGDLSVSVFVSFSISLTLSRRVDRIRTSIGRQPYDGHGGDIFAYPCYICAMADQKQRNLHTTFMQYTYIHYKGRPFGAKGLTWTSIYRWDNDFYIEIKSQNLWSLAFACAALVAGTDFYARRMELIFICLC